MSRENGCQISAIGLTTKKSILSAIIALFSMPSFAATLDVSGYDMTISDSNTYSNGHLYVGRDSDGSLTVNNGAVLNTRYNNTIWGMAIGGTAGVTGILTLTGAGTTLIDSNISHIGSSGNGYLNVLDGAKADLDIVWLGSNKGGTANGHLLVDGVGSSVTAIDEIAVGYESKGSMTITNGATVDVGAKVYIGRGNFSPTNSPDPEGAVVVSGQGSTLTTKNGVYVGTYGSGTLLVSDGGRVITTSTLNNYIAFDKPTEASRAIVTGTDSAWIMAGSLGIGRLGDGTLIVSDGALVSASHIDIAQFNSADGHLIIGSDAGQTAVGAGDIDADTIAFGAGQGKITFNHTSDNYQFSSAVSGSGEVNFYNGTTVMTGANTYSGTTTLYGGTLKAGTTNTLSAQSDYDVQNSAVLDLQGYDQTVNSLTNSGSVIINGAPGTVLTVNGDYIGNDGTVSFNNVLSDDSSVTDKLVINGDTSGNTWVVVNNLGGSGAQTLNGIELIQVNGSNSDGEFIQSGRIVAGAYDYTLGRGQGSNANNWYLTSALSSGNTNRPEAGSYIANVSAANTLFAMRLHDRLGETQYTDVLADEQNVTGMWLRTEGGHNRFRDDSGQLRTQSHRYLVQLGGDVAQWGNNSGDRWHLGIMAGYGSSKGNTRSNVSGHSSKSSVDGYSVGLYGTAYANNDDKSGYYLDSWVQYGWFDNTVKGQDLVSESYKSKGVSASLESGYTFKVTDTAFIQPKAQVIWMNVKADDHKESNGTDVFSKGDGNFQTRLGIKAIMQNRIGEYNDLQSFVEANWLHNSKTFSTVMDGVTVKQAGATQLGEIKVGVEGRIGNNFNLWGNLGQRFGSHDYTDTTVNLGVKYQF